MSTLGSVLTVIGYLVAAAGGIWIIVIAFQDSIVCGLGGHEGSVSHQYRWLRARGAGDRGESCGRERLDNDDQQITAVCCPRRLCRAACGARARAQSPQRPEERRGGGVLDL